MIKNPTTVSFPYIGKYTPLFKEFFESWGVRIILPPKITDKTIKIGARHSSEMICFPYKVTLGNFIEAIEEHPEIDYLIMYDSQGRCRFRHYHILQKQTLENLGFKTKMVALSHKNCLALPKLFNPKLNTIQIIKSYLQLYKNIKKISKINGISKDKPNVILIGEIYCYDNKTEILTEDGWKFFKDLKEERVIQVNSETLEMDLVKPNNTYSFDYKGKMIQLKSGQIDLLVTPNHRMLCDTKTYKGYKRKILRADAIPTNARIFKCGTWVGEEIEPKIFYKCQNKHSKHKYRRGYIQMSPEQYCKFMGIWLSEGSLCKWHNKKERRYRKWIYITQKKKEIREKIEGLLKELNINIDYNHYSKSRSGSYRFVNENLFDYLTQFGKSKEKYIPHDILNSKPSYLNIFLEWFGYGDGGITTKISKTIRYKNQNRSRITKTRCFYSSSKKLIDGIQEILIKLNKQGNILVNTSKKLKNPMYTLRVRKTNYCEINKNDIKKINYNGKIYCVEVNKKFIVVRRNNIACISGNTCIEDSINYNIEQRLENFGINLINTVDLHSFVNDAIMHLIFGDYLDGKYRKLAEKYLNGPIGGHGLGNIEYLLKYKDKGIQGAVWLRPLSCMPEATIDPIIKHICQENNIPLLVFDIDESNFALNIETRLETFVEQVKLNYAYETEKQTPRSPGQKFAG